MYILHGKPTNRSFRVLWMLEELGAEYKIEPIGPRSPEAFNLNPAGKVPILVDDSQEGSPAIIDSVACIQYLADKHGKFTAKAGTIERAHQDSLTFFALDDIDAILWVLAKHKFILPEELRVEEIRPACEHDFNRSLEVLETRLGDKPYLAGDGFSVPDIIVAHCLRWSGGIGFSLPQGKLSEYIDRVTSREGYQRAHEIRSQYQ